MHAPPPALRRRSHELLGAFWLVGGMAVARTLAWHTGMRSDRVRSMVVDPDPDLIELPQVA